MNYTVVWQHTAEQKLAELWTQAADRNAITAAANTIDAVLAQDPYSQSESRSGSTRIMIMAPLAVLFDLDEPNRNVSVWAVWQPFGRS